MMRSFTAVLPGSLVLLLAACDTPHPATPEAPVRPTLADFRAAGPVWELASAQATLQAGALRLPDGEPVGESADHALVPLSFDAEGRLHTAQGYGRMIDQLYAPGGASAPLPRTYVTDLATYRAVSRDPRGTPRFAQSQPVPSGTIWVFDPYVTCELHVLEGSSPLPPCRVNRTIPVSAGKTMALTPPPVDRGDFILGRHTDSNPLGHSGVVYRLNNWGTRGGDPWSPETKTMEARGYFSLSPPAPDCNAELHPCTPQDETGELTLGHYFLRPWAAPVTEYFEILRVRGLTDAQKNAVADWAKAQDPRPYVFPSPKSDPYTFHCFKLNWAAAKYGAGVDVDPDNGAFVLLWDLRYSAAVDRVYLWDARFAP